MALKCIDHVNVRCVDLEKSRTFYSEVLGLRDGTRPGVTMAGAWLYLGDRPVVHLQGGRVDDGQPAKGAFDHVAFEGDDVQATRDHLQRMNVPFRENGLPDIKLHQLVVRDPDGIKIEINFKG